jgi:hypothetical protein
MEEVILGLDWQDLSNHSVKQVCDVVAPPALTGLEGAWKEAWSSTGEGGKMGDEEVLADDE